MNLKKERQMGKKLRALVIDDTPDNVRLITLILNNNGIETIVAETGSQGIEKAERESPDFIILDILLPDKNGLDVLKAIRSLKSNGRVPVIAMTSYAMSGDRQRFLNAGCNGYIEKPINPMTVMTEIETILKGE